LIEIFLSTGQVDPPRLDYSPRPLEPAAGASNRVTAPVASPDYVRVLGSAAQNSRAPGSLHTGAWRTRWTSAVSSPPSAVLLTDNRILVQRSGGWTLFNRTGAKLREGNAGQSIITLDPSAGVFYALGAGSFLQAIELEQGELRFTIPLGYDESVIWPMFHRSGNRIIAAGIERPMMSPNGQKRPPRSLFQVDEINPPLKVSPYKVLLSEGVQQDMVFRESDMIPVAAGDVLWAVMPDLLVRTSAAQTISGAWTGSFHSVSASADEAGWLYLVVAPHDYPPKADRELWIVTPEGRRTVRVPVPPAYRESKVPPAVGYDHNVYLHSSHSIAAFSAQGALLWESSIEAEIAGLTVTPDRHVVVASGHDIADIDSNGKMTHLATLSAPATTAPVVAANGEILVGTEESVACLSAP
jgi:hypothetical protein